MKIFCIGRNYVAHAQELNNEVPDEPLIFMKPPTSLLKDRQPFFYPGFSSNVHFEGELVLRIEKNGAHIKEKFAHKYFSQITLGIDFTARDIQQKLKEKGHPWEISKGFDRAAAIGEWLTLADLPDPNAIRFTIEKNGETVQQGNTELLIFPFRQLIAYISKYFMLQQGDLIYTGTPAGVGPVQIGDELTGSIEGQELLRCEIR
ncbi:MAG: 2-hydroxyhepta-2,4-diene-1,7-dioate isomerase [Bacteroidetes bacterium SW_11_45_7]|nr:MAG: 2-hydroxyhepta-2,4-diene-1,7-dioate isomerase [Bacteroidetes bacterium SW_11_45_7]